MKNREYWRRRFEAIEKTAVRKGLKYNERLEKEYYKAMRSIESNIATWYQRFANNNEIDMAEAKRLLNTRELKEFRWTVEDYIRNGQDNAVSQEWIKELENASSKVHITRLESLQVQLQQEIEKLYGSQVDDIDKLTKSIYEDTYYHSAFEIQKGFNVGWNLQRFNEKQLQHVIETPWTLDDKTFSDRIWLRKEELLNMARTELSQTIIRGDAPDKAIKNIAKKLEVDKHKAGRLVMTESAYFASAAQKQCFTDLGVEKYEIVATLDSHMSEICQELDGKVRDMKDYKEGDTAPPFHPWCRTTTVPYFEDNYGERAARGEDGKTYYVPSDMTYKEWEEKHLKNNSDAEKDGKAKRFTIKTEQMQYYKEVRVDEEDDISLIHNYYDIEAKKIVSTYNDNIYISKNAKKMKAREIHELDRALTKTYNIIGKENTNGLNKPYIVILSSSEIKDTIPASYNGYYNTIFVNDDFIKNVTKLHKKEKLENETYTMGDKILSTILHENLHWYDRQRYIYINGSINNQQKYDNYINSLKEKFKKNY